MPLDPDWPPQRLQQLCDEARPAALLWAAAACPGGHGQPRVTSWPVLELPGLTSLLREGGDAADGVQAAAPPPQQQPQQPGQQRHHGGQPAPASGAWYLLYTSGSTGRPLGVLGTQEGLLNRCRWLERAHPYQVGLGVGVWCGLMCGIVQTGCAGHCTWRALPLNICSWPLANAPDLFARS